MSIFCNEILLFKFLKKFSKLFRKFSLIFDWERIQSSTTHMKFWIMFEYARIFVMIFLLLYIWFFKISHIRKSYQKVLKQKWTNELTKNNIDVAKFVIRNLIKIVKNNNVIIITNFIVANRVVLKHIVLNIRKDFAQLMNMIHYLKQNVAKKRVDNNKKKKIRCR